MSLEIWVGMKLREGLKFACYPAGNGVFKDEEWFGHLEHGCSWLHPGPGRLEGGGCEELEGKRWRALSIGVKVREQV